MFADAEMEVPTTVMTGGEISRPFEHEARLGRRGQICRAADQPRYMRSNGVEHLTRDFTSSHSLRINRKGGKVLIPPCRQFTALHFQELVSQLRKPYLVLREHRLPGRAEVMPTLAYPMVKMLACFVRHEELCILGPAVIAFGQLDFFFPQRFAVCGARVFLMGGTVGDMTVN